MTRPCVKGPCNDDAVPVIKLETLSNSRQKGYCFLPFFICLGAGSASGLQRQESGQLLEHRNARAAGPLDIAICLHIRANVPSMACGAVLGGFPACPCNKQSKPWNRNWNRNWQRHRGKKWLGQEPVVSAVGRARITWLTLSTESQNKPCPLTGIRQRGVDMHAVCSKNVLRGKATGLLV